MDNKSLVNLTGQARGKLMRLKQDLGRAKGNLESATRNRIVGGVMLLIGLAALIGFIAKGSQLVAVIAAAGLFIGGAVLIRALVKIGGARHSIDTMTGKVANAQTKLDDLKAQPPSAE